MKSRNQQFLVIFIGLVLLFALSVLGWNSPEGEKASLPNEAISEDHGHDHGSEDGAVWLSEAFKSSFKDYSWFSFSELNETQRSIEAKKLLQELDATNPSVLGHILEIELLHASSGRSEAENLFEAGKSLVDSVLTMSGSESKMAACVDYAALAFTKASELLPERTDVLNAKATLKVYLQEDVMGGVQIFLDVLKKEENNEAALYNLGMLSIQSGQWKKAEERFEKLVSLQPKNEQYAQILKDIRTQAAP